MVQREAIASIDTVDLVFFVGNEPCSINILFVFTIRYACTNYTHVNIELGTVYTINC